MTNEELSVADADVVETSVEDSVVEDSVDDAVEEAVVRVAVDRSGTSPVICALTSGAAAVTISASARVALERCTMAVECCGAKQRLLVLRMRSLVLRVRSLDRCADARPRQIPSDVSSFRRRRSSCLAKNVQIRPR